MRPCKSIGCGIGLAILLYSNAALAEVPLDFWTRLAGQSEGPVVLSIKYADFAARTRVLDKSFGGADLPFISRIVVRIDRDAALSMEDDIGIEDAEIFGSGTADRTFHKLIELYRIYLYQVSGKFNISAVNFSQGVRYFNRNSRERGDRTIAEALDVLGSRIAPVLVAVGDGPEFGVGDWAMAPSVLPVVATSDGGSEILANSARPEQGHTPWRTVLYADGAAQAGKSEASSAKSCGAGAHLTADQMLHPETSLVPQPGGSSYATFKVTSNTCYVQQYAELLRVLLRARTAIGYVEVEPFISYYVDSPVDRSCPALQYRWADQRRQYGAPRYQIKVGNKVKLDDFVSGHSIELRPNYSIPLLKAFLDHLPPTTMTNSGVKERYVSADAVLEMLRNFSLVDLVEVAANKRNLQFESWRQAAQADHSPILQSDIIDAIESYCRDQSLFLVLSDEAAPFFDTVP